VSTRPSTRPLTAALGTIPAEAWTAPSNYQDNRIHHLYQRCDLVVAGEWRPEARGFYAELGRWGGIHDAWISRIAPGGYIVPHTDASRWRERWHIPIQSAGVTVLNGVEHLPIEGHPLRVRHWQPHSVWCAVAKRDRIHLVIDLDRYVGPDETRPFVIL
jgi:hypothetical protein